MGRGNLGQNTTSGSDSMNKMVNQLIRISKQFFTIFINPIWDGVENIRYTPKITVKNKFFLLFR